MKIKRNIFNISMIIIAVFLLVACKNQASNDVNKNNESVPKTYAMDLYYPSKSYIVDGNEDKKFISQEIEVSDPTDIKKDIEKLKDSSNAKDKSKDIYPALSENLVINEITEEDGKYTVDISSENLNGGSLEEDIIISSIVNSILSIRSENGNYAKSVRFLVDGEPCSTLLGHVSIEEEFTESL